MSRKYFAHAHQFVGLLGIMDKRASSQAFRTLLASNSEAGRKIREHNGGDLITAIQEGPLQEGMMMYTHRLIHCRGSPSVFVTLDGMREIMNELPDANEVVKNKLKKIFADYLNHQPNTTTTTGGPVSPFSFTQATPEQCAKDDADEVIEEIATSTEGCVPGNESTTTVVVTQRMWYDVRVSSYESAADKRVLEAQLRANESVKVAEIAKERAEKELAVRERDSVITARDSVIAANESVKVAEIAKERAEKELAVRERDSVIAANESMKVADVAKERAEKERAQMEIACVKESAAKDIQIVKLQMKLELAEAKAKFRTDLIVSETDRLQRGERRDKVQRLGRTKMHSRDTIFAKLVSESWSNDEDSGVNIFSLLKSNDDDDGVTPSGAFTPIPQLTIRYLAGAEGPGASSSSITMKHRSFGFCFRGQAISENTLQKNGLIKEAYGVEYEGVQYLIAVCFKRVGLRLDMVSTMPYAMGLLHHTIMVDLIPGRDYHLAVYKTANETDDPVLEMLKRPSIEKWFWHSAGTKD